MTQVLVSISVLLVSALILGGIARRYSQPAILGELLAGIALGPSLFGRIAPEVYRWIFSGAGGMEGFSSGFNGMAASLLLLVAGLETSGSSIIRARKQALAVGVSGMLFPFVLGYGAATVFPGLFSGAEGVDPGVFRLFFATALSISALPVIAKILFDLDLIEGRIGTITLASAMLNDLAGWIVFAMVLGLARSTGHPAGLLARVTLTTAAFSLFVVKALPLVVTRIFPLARRHLGSPLPVVLACTLISAAFTEWIGIHALFGAFMVGVALSESAHIDAATREGVRRFVLSFFAPIFFASVGLKADFVGNFDLPLVAGTIAIACAGKILGCGWAGRLSGLPSREAWAIAVCLNARGAMEIILGAIALESGLIGQHLFVALVSMALITSLMVGPILTKSLGIHSRP